MSADPAAIYLDASANLRLLFGTPGPKAPLNKAVATASQLVEVEAFRTIDRSRLAGQPTDLETARKHQPLPARVHLFPGAELTAGARAFRGRPALTSTPPALGDPAEAGTLHFWTHDSGQAAAALTTGLEVRGVEGPRG